MWFGAGNVCVSGVGDALPKQHTGRICEGHEDLSSCKVVLEAIKFEEKPSCVKMDFSKSNHLTPRCACAARGNENIIADKDEINHTSTLQHARRYCSCRPWSATT